MQKVVKLNKLVIKRLKKIINDLYGSGYTDICPLWNFHKDESSCPMCKKLFPKIANAKYGACPCNNYTNPYLIKRLKEIIKYNEELENGNSN